MIKNIKVYNIKKKVKYSLVCSSIIAGALVLTACSRPNPNNALYTTTGNENIFEADVSVSQQNNVSDDEREENDINGNVPLENVGSPVANGIDDNFSSDDLKSFGDYLTANPVKYDYSNLYQLDKALAKDRNYVKPSSHKVAINNITGDELYDIVVSNNKAYLKETQIKTYHDFKKKELKAICDKIADVCNSQLEVSKDVDINELKCTLSNLKIFESGGSFCNGYVTKDYCFILSPNMAELLNMLDDENDMSDIVTHETIHIIQMGCPDTHTLNPNLVCSYGFVREFKDLEVNSLNNLWLIEASAEKCMCNYENQKPITYQNYINYMESFAMINLVNDNYHVNDAEHLVYKDNLSDLYDFFGAKTDAEKKEILNMMYSIQVMQQQPKDFYAVYEQQLGHEATSDEVASLNNELRSEVCQTLNRLFYRNLANKITTEKVSLNDIFYLISVYEMDLNNHVAYDISDCYDRNEDLMNSYVALQDEFFRALANNLNIDYDQLIEMYNNYTFKSNQGNNYDLSWLGNDKINYIDGRVEDLSSAITVNVRTANEQLIENRNNSKTK